MGRDQFARRGDGHEALDCQSISLAAERDKGVGVVWKARDPRLDRVVVIKDSSEQFSERFEFEARSVAALNHPHI